jgi:hypothetical protein
MRYLTIILLCTLGSAFAQPSFIFKDGKYYHADNKYIDGTLEIPYHPEALDWETRVINAGGSVSITTLQRVSDFCYSIDNAGYRTYFVRLTLFVGNDLIASCMPLYYGKRVGQTIGYNYDSINVATNFVYSESVGILKTAATSWLNTGIIAANESSLSLNGMGLIGYIRSDVNLTQYIMSDNTLSDGSYFRTVATYRAQMKVNAVTANAISANSTTNKGLWYGNRTTSTSLRLFKNGTFVASNATTTSAKSTIKLLITARGDAPASQAYINNILNTYAITDSVPNDATVTAISTLINDFYKPYCRCEYEIPTACIDAVIAADYLNYVTNNVTPTENLTREYSGFDNQTPSSGAISQIALIQAEFTAAGFVYTFNYNP